MTHDGRGRLRGAACHVRGLSFDYCHVIVFVMESDEEFFRHEPGIHTYRIRANVDIDLRVGIDTLHRTFDSGNIVGADRFVDREFHFRSTIDNS